MRKLGGLDTTMPALPRLICAGLLAALLLGCSGGQERTGADSTDAASDDGARPYSLIPRTLLFGDPQRARGRLSPDGTTLAWLEPDHGVLNIFAAPVDSPRDAKVITQASDVGVYDFDWLKNNTHIAYVVGRGGAEPQRVHVVDVITGDDKDVTPGGPETHSWVAATSWDYPDEMVIAANDRDPDYDDLHRVNVITGESTRLYANAEGFTRLYLDRSLRLTSASRDLPDGQRELYNLDREGGWRLRGTVNAEDALTTRFVGYDGTNTATYVIDSRGRDYAALTRFDLQAGQTSVLATVAGVDISDVLLHPTTFEADAALIDGLSVEWLPLTSRAANAFAVLDQRLKDPYQVLSRTVDDRLWIVLERGPTNPGVYHLFNRETGRVDPLIDVRPDLAAHHLAPMTPLTIKARDGLDLVSYLTLPAGADADGDGKPETRSPLVIIPDVGPQRRTSLSYDAVHQWLADRGYAALSVNVRGAAGFGKAYRAAGDGEIGGAVQDDIRDAAQWAVEHDVAEPDRMAVFGIWLGGHAGLIEAAAPDTPFACAASYNAPADLVGLVENAPPYWGEFVTFLRQRLGDPADPDVRTRLAARSPINFASSITLPVLIGAGGLDGGAQSRLTRETAQKAYDAGAPAAFISLPEDAGNLRAPRDKVGFYAVLEAFFADCLGGRLEPIEDDVRDARLEAPLGAEHIPALEAALEAEPAPQ